MTKFPAFAEMAGMIRFIALALIWLCSVPAYGQDTISTSRPPTPDPVQTEIPVDDAPPIRVLQGDATQRLNVPARFENDPIRLRVRVVPEVSASELAAGCTGFMTREPSVVMNYAASDLPLFIQATSQTPIAIVVSGPDGTLSCTQAAAGSREELYSNGSAQSGQYRVWVGPAAQSRRTNATVIISELAPGGPVNAGNGPAVYRIDATGRLNPRGPAALGDLTPLSALEAANTRSASLSVRNGQSSGWQVEDGVSRIIETPVEAGGYVEASIDLGSGRSCAGYVPANPTATFEHSGLGTIDLYTRGNVDTILFVQRPDGGWYCNDDTWIDTNSALRLANIPPGQYAVFVGTYADSSTLADRRTNLIIEPDSGRLAPGRK